MKEPTDTKNLLTPEEIDAIKITKDDTDELGETAAIGLTDCEEDHRKHVKRVIYLLEQRLKEKVAKAQHAKDMARLDSQRDDIAQTIARLPKGTIGITDPEWANKRLEQAYPKAAQIIALIKGESDGK